jgi:hypothetical protein
MRRRALVLVLGGVAAAWPFALWAQPQRGVWRIGYLAASPRPTDDAFRQALRELGYIEGHNLTILYRWGESGNNDAMAQDLVRLNVDLIAEVASRRAARMRPEGSRCFLSSRRPWVASSQLLTLAVILPGCRRNSGIRPQSCNSLRT